MKIIVNPANQVRAVLAKFPPGLSSFYTTLRIARIFSCENPTPACRTVSKNPEPVYETSYPGEFLRKISLRWQKTWLLNWLNEPKSGSKYPGKFDMETFNELIYS